MSSGDDRFCTAVGAFMQALSAREPEQTRFAQEELMASLDGAGAEIIVRGCTALAPLLDHVPPGARPQIANMVGAYVTTADDAVECAPVILANLAKSLGYARQFAEQWRNDMGTEPPDPDTTDTDYAWLDRFGLEPLMGWWTLSQWVSPALAMLQHRRVRELFGPEGCQILAQRHGDLAECSGRWFKELAYMLALLDDAPLVALHRETGTGYLLRMTGIADNFQLHTLLADVLLGDQHLPGARPSAEAAAMCRDAAGQAPTVGAFNLVAPDGDRIWNEGTPADIPVFGGTRVLVLDPPPYERHWPAGRYFPFVPADLVLERALTAEEAAQWFEHVRPANDPTGAAPA
ncbi:hypothetical protein [Nocardia vulneris]|uniref:Uncharacterized protein n=1 Tax=Nocardia vulneris TaxID=1141657 RepID=A0ABR4ZFG0_9NOCA|nr:hypothetical protein [Nocardia vulneris]KIA64132.1 hypothetical protein FG87_15845 [Nocardia vulneris]